MGKGKMKVTGSNFGKYGWFLIIFCMVLNALSAGLNVSGLNMTISHFVESKGWSQAILLNYSTIGGWIVLVFQVFLGWWMHKVGAKRFLGITLLICGFAVIWWGNAGSPVQYFIACALVNLLSNGFATLGTSNLIALFYPKRKGVALGWTTMGINFADILWLPMLGGLIAGIGFNLSYVVIGVFVIVCGIVSFLFVADSPEKKGLLPDNGMVLDTEEVAVMEKPVEISFGIILKTPAVWLIGIVFGIQYMCCSGIFSQALVYLTGDNLQMAQPNAVTFISIAAVAGVFGSYAWGWIDGKFGTKTASVLIAIWYIVALALVAFASSSVVATLFAFAMIYFAAGGTANLAASFTAEIFEGQYFAKAFGVIMPIMMAIRSTGFSVVAFGLSRFGSFNYAYMILMCFAIVGLILTLFIKNKKTFDQNN